MMRYLHAEIFKLATLPSTWIATALMIGLPIALAALNGNYLAKALASGPVAGLENTSTFDEGFGQLTYGLVGVAVLAVTSVSSEYARNARTVGSGRQVTTATTAAPRRLVFLLAKLTALTGWILVSGALAIPFTIAASRSVLGPWAVEWTDAFYGRGVNAALYWVAMAWIAFGITWLLRNGIIPLAVLITNVSMVSFSLLAAKATPWAKYLPDLAAYPSFIRASPIEHPLAPAQGMLVTASWALGCVLVAAITFISRDV